MNPLEKLLLEEVVVWEGIEKVRIDMVYYLLKDTMDIYNDKLDAYPIIIKLPEKKIKWRNLDGSGYGTLESCVESYFAIKGGY